MATPNSAFADVHSDKPEKQGGDRAQQIRQDSSDDGSDAQLLDQKAMERRVLLKLDLRILPVLALLFLFSFLDRTNIGNAASLGLRKDLGLNTHQYAVGLTVYYLFYILSEVPSNLLMKKVRPRIWLPLITGLWGIVAMCLGFIRNYADLVAVRSLLGITEGGLLPGIVLFLSMIYTRREMGLRMGLIYVVASLSGAFGGLLARGLYEIPATSTIRERWRWIFIIEGILTLIAAVIAYIFLPNSVEEASFLSAAEKRFALQRLQGDRPVNSDNQDGGHSPAAKESMDWSEVRRGFLSVQTWLSASAYFAILSGLYSFGLFTPTIITGLGYSATRAQLFSVPPYAVASFITVIVAYISDRLWLRGPVILCVLPLAIAGYALIGTIESNSAKYGALFLSATGMYCSVPAILVWLTSNAGSHYKRATVSALQLAVANCGGFVAAWIYPSSQAPNYQKSHYIILGLLCYAWVAVLANTLFCHWVNKRKQAGKYDQYAGYGDDRDPKFKLGL